MSLSAETIADIKSIINKFINENGFVKSEEDVQSSYTLEILKLLGWDSSKWKINTSQEVKTGNKPDILLKGSGGGTIFIIESKAPKQSLDGKYANKTFKDQTCDYCNSEGIYWGVLTNFTEWRIYNSYRREPYWDKEYFTIIDNEVNDDDKLFDFFEKLTYSNLNSTKGRIDSNPVYYKKQEEIKDEFFTNLKVWRHKLRTFLFNKLKTKTDEPLTLAVEKLTQKILDRLIFIEVCNDKNIISYDILGSILYSKRNKYEELKAKFRELDEKFNSDLFADDVDIDSLEIDDAPMEEIIRGINNIDFSKLSVHIIGEVYENYLGEILKKRKDELKLVEIKEHAKRKSQGIYYTPDYIVNYIVENTLGEILKNCKTEQDIQRIRVLDPACGSGSFLIRAFDEFYKAYLNCSDKLSLFDDLEIKKKILLYNLYGVDLDERAVEIAKLNLLIKALEGFTENALTGRKLLPNLNLNIRCGNSLISGKSIFDMEEGNLFDNTIQFRKDIDILIKLKEQFRHAIEDEEKEKLLEEVSVHEEMINSYLNKDLKRYFKNINDIKPFNYEVAFCEIFKEGGFDCVIGNPPYVNAKMLTEIYEEQRNFLSNSSNYRTLYSKWDIYIVFVEKGLMLLNKGGYISMIIPFPFINQTYAKILRKHIIENFDLLKIVDLSNEKIFKEATVNNCIFVITNQNTSNKINIFELKNKQFKNILSKSRKEIVADKETYIWDLKSQNKISLKSNKFKTLGEYCFISKGMVLNADEVKSKGKFVKADLISDSKSNIHIKKYIEAKDIEKYNIKRFRWLEWNTKRVPLLISRPTFPELYEQPKIFINKIGNLVATYDNDKLYCDQTIRILVLWKYLKNIKNKSIDNSVKRWYKNSREILEKNSININYKYLLGIINSKITNVFLNEIRGIGNIDINPEYLKNLPIHTIDFNNKHEKSLHDKLVKLVDEMIKLNKHPEKNKIKIKAKDKEIDELVYKLYGLTDEEIKIVEGKE